MLFGFCFTDKAKVANFSDVASADELLFKDFFHGMLGEGVYFAPSMYEAGFVSAAHGAHEISKTQAAAEKVLSALKRKKSPA